MRDLIEQDRLYPHELCVVVTAQRLVARDECGGRRWPGHPTEDDGILQHWQIVAGGREADDIQPVADVARRIGCSLNEHSSSGIFEEQRAVRLPQRQLPGSLTRWPTAGSGSNCINVWIGCGRSDSGAIGAFSTPQSSSIPEPDPKTEDLPPFVRFDTATPRSRILLIDEMHRQRRSVVGPPYAVAMRPRDDVEIFARLLTARGLDDPFSLYPLTVVLSGRELDGRHDPRLGASVRCRGSSFWTLSMIGAKSPAPASPVTSTSWPGDNPRPSVTKMPAVSSWMNAEALFRAVTTPRTLTG